MWRQRLRGGKEKRKKEKPVRFALVDRGEASLAELSGGSLELLLPSGERLRIERGVDAETFAWCWRHCAHDPLAGQRARVFLPDAV